MNNQKETGNRCIINKRKTKSKKHDTGNRKNPQSYAG
jgi:hypothetical protein